MTAAQDGPEADDLLDEKLYGLVDIAEQQQSTAKLMLDDLKEQCAALARERQQWSDVLGIAGADMEARITAIVSSSMGKAVDAAAEAIRGSGQPLVDQLDQAAADAEAASEAFGAMVGWATSRALVWGLGALAGLVLLGWLASGTVLWWDTKAIATAHVAKQQLQAEVAEMRANRDEWVKAGMATRLQHCGVKQRLCIAVNEAAGAFGDQGDYRLIKGG